MNIKLKQGSNEQKHSSNISQTKEDDISSSNQDASNYIQGGLSTVGVAKDTLHFLERSLLGDKQKLHEQDQHVKDNFMLEPFQNTSASQSLNTDLNKPFLQNHGPQVPLTTRQTTGKQWNKGTVDIGKYADRLRDIQDKVDGGILLMEKSKLQINQHAKNTQIGESARYTMNSENSGSSSKSSKDHDDFPAPEYISQKTAMQSHIAEEDAEFSKFISDEDEDFDREMRKIDRERAAKQQTKKMSFEPDISKWEGTGLLDEVMKEQEKEQPAPYTNPLARKRKQKPRGDAPKQASEETKQAPTAPKILTGPPGLKNISQTSNLSNNLNINRPEKESLFPKSSSSATSKKVTQYMTLDGPVTYEPPRYDEVTQGALDASYTSISQHLRASDQQAQLRKYTKDKIQSLSRFFVLKSAEKLKSHHSHNKDRIEQIQQDKWKSSNVKVYTGQQNMTYQDITDQTLFHKGGKKAKQSQNLSQFGQLAHQNQQSQSQIPLVKPWFESLELEDRVLAVTTIDPKLSGDLRRVFAKLKKTANNETGKFKMITSTPSAVTSIEVIKKDAPGGKDKRKSELGTLPPISYTFQLCHSQAHKSSHEKIQAELELLSYVRFTDTYEMHDTLTVHEDLVRDPCKFYELAEIIVGKLYLKRPHDVHWLGDCNESGPLKSANQLYFESCAPPWFEMHNPNSLAAWILYYVERALFIQWGNSVQGDFLAARDQNKQPVFIPSDGKYVAIKNELKPFWRTFCEDHSQGDEGQEAVTELLDAIRIKTLTEFGVKVPSAKEQAKVIDSFHGGLNVSSEAEVSQKHFVDKIDSFLDKIKLAINNYKQKECEEGPFAESQIDFKSICINTLCEAIEVNHEKTSKEVAKSFCFDIQTQRGPHTISVGKKANSKYEPHIDMRLERIFVEQLKEHINQKLKSRYTSQNKTLQKKKLKKLKQKKLQQEKEREEKEREQREKRGQEDSGKQEQVETNLIKINNEKAIEMLIGKTPEPKQYPQKEFNLEDFQEIIQSKKKNKRANKQKGPPKKEGKDTKVIISDEIVEKGLLPKPSTPEQKNQQTKNQQVPCSGGKMVDQHNYFQVFGHKYAASLESQGGQGSQKSSDISGLGSNSTHQVQLSNQPAGLGSSRCGTIKTTSTCEESKKTQVSTSAQSVNAAMSNQEVLKLQNNQSASSMQRMGNAQIQNTQWQRSSNLRGLVNDLISERSSNFSESKGIHDQEFQIIDVQVKGNIIHTDLDDNEIEPESFLATSKAASSSESSKGPLKKIITFKKRKPVQRQIPYRARRSPSDQSSQTESEGEDMLPDLYTNYVLQPEENDSSDYGGESGQVGSGDGEEDSEDSVVDDNSSQRQVSRTQNSKKPLGGSPKVNIKKRKISRAKGKSAGSNKKSTQSAAANVEPFQGDASQGKAEQDGVEREEKKQESENKPTPARQVATKAVKNKKRKNQGAKIDFYNLKQPTQIENVQNEPVAVIEESTIVNRWTKLKEIPTFTCQMIELTKELTTEFVFPQNSKKQNKKNKKQKKLDWESRYATNIEETPIQQIEIIKPVVDAKQTSSNPKEQTLLKSQGQTKDGADKGKKQKKKDGPVSSAEAMNSFIKKLAGKGSQAEQSQQMPQSSAQPEKKPEPVVSQAHFSKKEESKEKDKGSPQKPSQGKQTDNLKESHVADNAADLQKTKSYEAPAKVQFKQKGSQMIHQSNPQQRLSMMEEAKILSTGYRYEAKKQIVTVNAVEGPTQEDTNTDTDGIEANLKKHTGNSHQPKKSESNQGKSQNVKKTFGGLSLESKEYKMVPKSSEAKSLQEAIEPRDQQNESKRESNQQDAPSVPQEKKKAKKQRSAKNKRRKAPVIPQSWIDPATGEEVFEQPLDSTHMQQLMDGGMANHALLNQLKQGMIQHDGGSAASQQPGNQHLNFNQQVQDLLLKLNEQVFAQQQQQIQEMQIKQQQENDMLIQEECQPCAEIDSARSDLFFEELEQEMKNKVKDIDLMKDSVRKERQGFISIVENIVKNTFSNKYGNGYVGIKIFGSMATELAIETSDVDLVVTGINSFGNNQHQQSNYGRDSQIQKNQLLNMMQRLYDNLKFLKQKGQIHQIKFIHGASVPIIKLVVDLQVINDVQIEKAIEEFKRDRKEEQQMCPNQENDASESKIDIQGLGLNQKQIDEKMRYLKVDISIDEQSQQYFKYDNNNSKQSHSGIDTIYHIQELVLQRKDLRPIVMIIKKIFDETFLSMPYFGGISSYSLVLMVSAYLKRFDPDKQGSLSRNLSGFFHFYGVGFKPHLFYLKGDIIEFCENQSLRPFSDPFIVLDPLDNSNNISHSTYRIQDIQKALIQAFKVINETCERFQMDANDFQSQPKQVLERLMTDIRSRYQVNQNIYDDDF